MVYKEDWKVVNSLWIECSDYGYALFVLKVWVVSYDHSLSLLTVVQLSLYCEQIECQKKQTDLYFITNASFKIMSLIWRYSCL